MKVLIFIFLFIFSLVSQADTTKKVTLITMEIPPYMSSSMPDQGAAISALRRSFKKAGYSLEVVFVPVPRIRAIGLKDETINGFFPSFKDEVFEGHKLTLSKIFYQTPWVVVERKEKPIKWEKSQDLLKYKGGNVSGYMLRSEVADAYKNHMERLEPAKNDTINILKLIFKRIDFIFIDMNVFKYISKTNKEIKPHADNLTINKKVVSHSRYGISFKPGPKNMKIMEKINEVIDEAEYTKWVENYLNELP